MEQHHLGILRLHSPLPAPLTGSTSFLGRCRRGEGAQARPRHFLVLTATILVAVESVAGRGANQRVKGEGGGGRVVFTTGARRARVSCLSWKWRKRSSVKIAERTYEKGTKALHRRGEGGHSEAAPFGQGSGLGLV